MTYQLSVTTEIGVSRSIAEIAFWKPLAGGLRHHGMASECEYGETAG
jgi:hypothetical protein